VDAPRPEPKFSPRAGSGDGCQYAITYEAEDESGNTERRTVSVVAPHDQSVPRQEGVEQTALEDAAAGGSPSAPRVVAASRGGFEVRFGLRRADRVRVEVFDLLGARVRVLVDGVCAAGEQAHLWDGRDSGGRTLGSGVYLVRLRGNEVQWSAKAVLVR